MSVCVRVRVNELTKNDERREIEFVTVYISKTEHNTKAHISYVCAVRIMHLCWHSVFGARLD